MIYGRVIGNELRDVPPECLPIWGQRWSGYRAPHGPSPFSTRIFSVDRMSEMGPALTSPAQFEVAEEDEGEDASSESSRLYSSFPSSPLAIQPDATELTSRAEIPTPRSVYRSSSHPHGSPKMLHRSTRHPPLQNSTCFSTTLLPRRQSERSGIPHHPSEPLLHPHALHHGIPIQGDRESFGDDFTLWNMDRTSTSIQPLAGPSYGSHVPSGQLQHTMSPQSSSIPEWQYANAHAQSSTYPFQPNPSSHPGSGYLLQADDRTRFIPTTPPSSSNCLTIPLPQQFVGIDSSWSHESSITMFPGVVHPRNPMMVQWPSGSGVFYHLVSDHHGNSSHPEDFFDTFAHAEGCTPLSLDKPGGDQFTR